MFQECNGKTEKHADDATHYSPGDTMEETKKLLCISEKIARKYTKMTGKWRMNVAGPKPEVVIL